MNKFVKIGLLFLVFGFFYSCQQPKEKVKYYPNGKIEEICTYRNGIMDGKFVAYYETGVLHSEGKMRNGQMVGEWKHYYPDGKIMNVEKHNWRGRLKTFDSWDKNGNHVIVDGKGTCEMYYSDESIMSRISYKDCNFDGVNESWYPNGQKAHEHFYKDGKPTGVWRTWDENGELTSTENHDEL